MNLIHAMNDKSRSIYHITGVRKASTINLQEMQSSPSTESGITTAHASIGLTLPNNAGTRSEQRSERGG